LKYLKIFKMIDIQFIPLSEAHLEMVRVWRNSESVSKYMYTSDYISEDQQLRWYNRIKNDDSQKYWIIKKEDFEIGLISLNFIKPSFKTAYWAFYIGDDNARDSGIGAKIEFKFLNYYFDELRFNKLMCEVLLYNDKVIKLHEKFGFRREGYLRQHILKDKIYYDVVSLAILKTEWLNIRDSFSKILNR